MALGKLEIMLMALIIGGAATVYMGRHNEKESLKNKEYPALIASDSYSMAKYKTKK